MIRRCYIQIKAVDVLTGKCEMTTRVRKRTQEDTSNSKVLSSMRPPSSKRLYFYHEIDAWQQDNHFINSGYVKETSSFKECFNSLFYLHNETVNIYSHLIPSSFVFWYVLYYVNFKLTIYENYLGLWEKLNIVQFGVAATFCLWMSSTFHCIKSHSHKVSRFGNQLDYFGIVIMITCSLISIVLFVFYDMKFWRNTFVGLFLVLGIMVGTLTLHPKFSSNTFRPLRSFMFITFGLSGILPVLAAVYHLGYEVAALRSNVFWLIMEGVLYIVGAVLYAMRIPERFSYDEEKSTPINGQYSAATFDIFGHSHQIFHIMVVSAAWCHWVALISCYDYLHQHTLRSLDFVF